MRGVCEFMMRQARTGTELPSRRAFVIRCVSGVALIGLPLEHNSGTAVVCGMRAALAPGYR